MERTALEEEARRAKREKEKAELEKKRALEKIKEEKARRAGVVGRMKPKGAAKDEAVVRARAKTRPTRRVARVEAVRGGDGWDAIPAGAGEVGGEEGEEVDGDDGEDAVTEGGEDGRENDEEQEDEGEQEEVDDEEERDSEDDEETRVRDEAHYAGYRAARRAEVIRLMGGGDGDGWADIPANAGEAWDNEEENSFDDEDGEREYDASYYEEEPDV